MLCLGLEFYEVLRQTWKITVDQYINAELGSNVTILCSFSNPKEYDSDDVKVYWKTFGKTIEINDKDKKAFVYHPNETFMLENYRGRTKLIGDIKKKNCSLQIQEISPNDEPTIYMRLSIKENYSFVKNPYFQNVIANRYHGEKCNPNENSHKLFIFCSVYMLT
uniref:Immunoglobulin V-set domain-containing protein n=1 Tax=Seriola lalandi dorsalis TaxID=1841481 RepID=A0A3B4WPT1_SERLL